MVEETWRLKTTKQWKEEKEKKRELEDDMVGEERTGDASATVARHEVVNKDDDSLPKVLGDDCK